MSKTNIVEKDNEVEKLQRFVALKGGQFWVAKKNFKKKDISAQEVLMLAGVDYVDDKPHTVRVRLHPSKTTEWKTEVKFLVDKFMSSFEWISEDEAAAVRDAEVKAIQDKLNTEQENLKTACSDVNELDRMIAKDNATESGAKNLPVKQRIVDATVISAIKTQNFTSLMQTGLTPSSVDEVKRGMEDQRDIAVKRSEWIQERTNLLSEIASEMTPFFEEKGAIALAQTQDMRDHIDNLMKGIGNLNLYVLKNVEIERLKKGKSAPEDEKLTLTQRVLYMDEELAVYEDINDQFDCRDRELFWSSIGKHQRLIDQIFPANRCVVAIATTRKIHDYHDQGYNTMEVESLQRENQTRFLLIRDGENVHLVLSPELWHRYTLTLFPTSNESNAPFKGIDGREITYRDLEYTSALKKHERIALGYKRMLILLCGLDHNHQLFGKFYDGNPSVEFMSEGFQERYFNFIYDEEGRGLLPSYCPVSIYDWAKEMNNEIGPGSRVILRWRSLFLTHSIPGCFERPNAWNTSRGNSPDIQYTPTNDDKNGFIEGHLIKNDGNLCMEIPVSGRTLKGDKRSFNSKLNMSIAMRHTDRFDYLCVDRLNPEDATFYLNHRPSRVLNISGIRMLKRAIKMAEDDREYEKPVRDKLLEAVMSGGVSEDKETAIRLIDRGIARYKCAHPRQDVLALLDNKKAFNSLCDQLFQLSGKGRDLVDDIREKEKSTGRNLLQVTLLANGQHCAYSTPLPAEIDNRLEPFAWVARTRYKALKKGVSAMKTTFSVKGKVTNSETTIYQSDDYEAGGSIPKQIFTSPNAKAVFFEDIDNSDTQSFFNELKTGTTGWGDIDKVIDAYIRHRKRLTLGSKQVMEPTVQVLLGALITGNGNLWKFGMRCRTWEYICLLYTSPSPRDGLLSRMPSSA